MKHLFNELSLIEKSAMNKYIELYAFNGGDKVLNSRRAPLTTILAPWEKAKSKYLYKMLGNNLILRKPITINRPEGELEERLSELRSDSSSAFYKFDTEFYNCIYDQIIRDTRNLPGNCSRLYRLLDKTATNIYPYSDETILYLPDMARPLVIRKGDKLMRIFSKIAKAYNLTSFEEFRLEHSRILNHKALSGNLCLSIHPLDYMTMSDNNCNWESCMSWIEQGEYRMGTIEMMNSDCVIMAYLESTTPFSITADCDWSNKKWRELFVVNENIAIGVKGYPYQSDELEGIALDWLRELITINLGYDFEDTRRTTYWNGHNICNFEHTQVEYYLNIITDYMYDDFGLRDADSQSFIGHPLYLSKNLITAPLYLHYSGEAECMWCGATHNTFDKEDYNGFDIEACCCDVCRSIRHCYACDAVINADEAHFVDGHYYCTYCVKRWIVEDFFEPYAEHDAINTATITIVKSETNSVVAAVITANEIINQERQDIDYKKYLKHGFSDIIHTDPNTHIIYFESLTDDGLVRLSELT